MEIGYIVMYLFNASKKDRILTFKPILLFNVFGFGLICVLTRFLTQPQKRVQVLRWICMTFSLCIFVASLFIVRKVIRTKSVEFIPFSLSFFLTLSAVMWFFYGFLKKDQFVAVPNIMGLLFGILQMLLYMIYRNSKKVVVVEPKLHLEIPEHVVDLEKLGATICSEIAIVIPMLINDGGDGIIEDQISKEQAK
ncbi:RAG1-ACTIVATING PROTEIN 1 [Salix viminalis]|uniref:RAG1-ACTIVATING PROTEIN 1 n=1 Tax=Salix viminalis TaxID=40686 RepID=A0A9Q0NV72_SALVM|nr:RAG1-ACTIVATING PROTEIN 1 [Salix viminalis]